MGEVIANTEIPREKGWIYYTGTNSKGNLTLCRAKMGRKKKNK